MNLNRNMYPKFNAAIPTMYRTLYYRFWSRIRKMGGNSFCSSFPKAHKLEEAEKKLN